MERTGPQSGAAPILILFVVAALAALLAAGMAERGARLQRERISDRALAQAREALIAYAADRPIDGVVGPGYLPCPDADNDGWAEATCGSLSGSLGQDERLGRLPWKTLGLPDLRDGDGERLWYAVSTRHKGLLNCAASSECVDMSPATALGYITVRESSGAVIHDGTLADPARASQGGAAAVVIAPGAPLARGAQAQRRDCAPRECDALGRCLGKPPRAVARCDPANYLDVAGQARFAFEDNADFHDRSDAAGRAGNGNGFIQGPVVLADGRVAVNDRVAILAWHDLTARVMGRVALELAHCLRRHAAGVGAYPRPSEACEAGGALGRVPDDVARTAAPDCAARLGDPAWWPHWKPYVLYARGADPGLELVDADGRVLAAQRPFAVLVTRRADDCAAGRVACTAAGCTRAVASPLAPRVDDVVVAR